MMLKFAHLYSILQISSSKDAGKRLFDAFSRATRSEICDSNVLSLNVWMMIKFNCILKMLDKVGKVVLIFLSVSFSLAF